MKAMRHATWILGLAALFILGCNAGESARDGGPRPLFGDGTIDNTRVVATVNGENITERMLDLRMQELTGPERARFAGEDGRRLLVRKMVDELLAVRAAEEAQLDQAPEVRRVLTYQYRTALSLAHDGLLNKDVEPTVDQIREYFERNRDRYVRLGTMHASHIACNSEAAAQEAYLSVTRDNVAFSTAARRLSKNAETAAEGGDLGWFNRSGFIPTIKDSKGFTEAIWELEDGINPPLEFGGQWHVVNVHKRQFERPMTLDEAYGRVVAEVTPELQRQKKQEWLAAAKSESAIEYFGEFRPGQGKTAKELLERAFYVKDPQQKADLLTMLVEDYPDDEYTDDAMFMAGNLYLDEWGDKRQASLFLLALVRKFPESEFAQDAQFLLDNMHRPGAINPKSIEELRQQ